MEEIEVTPFLVSCSKKQDYTTIVAPQFICQVNISDLLRKKVARYNRPTKLGTAIYLEVDTQESGIGKIILIFRTIWASAKHINEQGDETLKDSFGRPIALIEGIVLMKPIVGDVIASTNLEKAHQQIIEHYYNFWQSPQPVEESKSFNLLEEDSDANQNLLLIKILESSQNKQWRCIRTFSLDSRYPPEICSVTFSQDEKLIVARSINQTITIWDWERQKVEFTQESNLLDSVGSIALSPDGNIVATGMIDRQSNHIISLWNWKLNQNQNITISNVSQIGVYNIAFHYDEKYGKFLVSSNSLDNIIDIWKLKKRRNEASFSKHNTFSGSSSINCFAINQIGKYMIGGNKSGELTLWDFEYTTRLDEVPTNSGCINSVCFSHDGCSIASGSELGKIKLFNITRGRLNHLQSLEIDSPVNSVCFSSQGHLVAAASDDSKIRIWDLNKDEAVTVINAHKKEVTSVKFSENDLLSSGSKDGTVKIWSTT